MKLFRDPPAQARPCALAIGNFDGVHTGHQAMIARTVAAAQRLGIAPSLVVFEPMPMETFSRENAPPRLTTLIEKAALADQYGIEQVFALRFNRAFASQSPDAFIQLLVHQLKARWVLVGADFHFGKHRTGDTRTLQQAAQTLGFELEVLADVLTQGERASSTWVRSALARGDLSQAETLLGRPYAITGRVVHGDKRGRTIGFPTANIALGPFRRSNPPLWGVYAVKCKVEQASKPTQWLKGAASLGRNPAVKDHGPPSLEVHFFDFSGDLYGAKVTVEWVKKLRDEAHYPSLAALVEAIEADCNAAKLALLHSF